MLKRFTKKIARAFGGKEKWITFAELSPEKIEVNVKREIKRVH